ncbi:MAG TPA: ATP-binding protein, partial [Mariprofundaceae bacterium]|nr:ATP-binding protein [Mariprofundaceae bacterium]
ANLFRNLGLMANRMGLTDVQMQLLSFVVLKNRYEHMNSCFESLHKPSEFHLSGSLAYILGIEAADISKALTGKSSLRERGLLKIVEDYRAGIDLEPMDGLCQALMAENANEQMLISHFLVPAREGTLYLEDYPHAATDIDILERMLDASLKAQDKGVNILVYGSPGSGKTELARLLSLRLQSNLYEVKTENADGDPVNAQRRLEGYRFSQQMLAGNDRSLILFDEIEDVFPSRSFSFFGMEVKSGDNKGWINKSLEENKTPAIWVCNQVRQIDPAFLRRFDFALELNTPPKSVRLNIVRSRLTSTPVSEPFMQRLAEHEELSPAQIAKAATVLGRVGYTSQKDAEAILDRVLSNGSKAMGQKLLGRKQPHSTGYSLDYLNANVDIPRLVEGLQLCGRGNLCFYGAPGTGKTALAGYIAEQLDKPLVSKRASDILGMYLGQTEQNIARMFEQATEEDAVLVLDEADSLLRDRRGASRSWEVSQVNELLVQMENFDGLFICSTNLMDDLDQASLRRFAIKVQFDYLKPDQAWAMLLQECIGEATDNDRKSIAGLNRLAPGDFSAVKKRLSILGLAASANEMIEGLRAEVAVKGGSSNSIGFVH